MKTPIKWLVIGNLLILLSGCLVTSAIGLGVSAIDLGVDTVVTAGKVAVGTAKVAGKGVKALTPDDESSSDNPAS